MDIKYTREQFYALIEAVEDQGGKHLDENCTAVTYPRDSFSGKRKLTQDFTSEGCGLPSVFEIPYEPDDTSGPQPIKVCAYHDGVGLWPRFVGKVMGA